VPRVFEVDPNEPDLDVIREAAEMIRDGLVVAYPTDTLYGLAVDPRNAEAVQRLYALKGRPETSALTLIAADIDQLRSAAELSAPARRLAAAFWPGPLTIVLRAKAAVAPALAGGTSVGVRVPDHPVATALARAAGVCVTATSANRSGATAASSADAAMTALPDLDAVIDAGPARGGAPSTIVDASGAEISLIRAGAVAWDRVLRSVQ